MHTSVAELRYDRTAREAMVAIRVYSDDLAGAVPGANRAVADSALARYVRGGFARRPPGAPSRSNGRVWSERRTRW
jgi:hypothetical protein